MAGFLPEHLPFSSAVGDHSTIGSAIRSTHESSVGEQSNDASALVGLSKRQNTLVERRSLLFKLKGTHKYDDPGKAKHRICRARHRQFYRVRVAYGERRLCTLANFRKCDIHAVSSEDERAAQVECKQLVMEAGGSIVNNFEYLGGFLFELAPGCVLPIETGDITAKGGSIVVEPWQPFGGYGSRSRAPTEQTKGSRGFTGVAGQRTIDGLFGCAKRTSLYCVDGTSSSINSGSREQEELTLMDMLFERHQRDMERANGRADLDDAAEWVTLSDANDFDL